ncbi:SMI1/KNR4 family protein [Variovorax paradoxus]|uniref:Knr4/Smi1-like domain-containing protein n=1 Tax=Variovorax paradoxus (strain S110) TaxID=543728 RepID=C5CKZ9_VARPS
MPFDLDERCIQAAEQALGVSFPTSYRVAMMRSNGGAVATESDDWDLYLADDNYLEPLKVVDAGHLYPIADDSDRKRFARTLNGVVPETQRARDWRGFPSTAVLLGGNGEGDQLVFLAVGKGLGPKIFIWRHETCDLVRVADDFAALVTGAA